MEVEDIVVATASSWSCPLQETQRFTFWAPPCRGHEYERKQQELGKRLRNAANKLNDAELKEKLLFEADLLAVRNFTTPSFEDVQKDRKRCFGYIVFEVFETSRIETPNQRVEKRLFDYSYE